MEDTPEIWTTEGFLDHVMNVVNRMPDRAFCFILGAGASVPSGIPAGGALVQSWLEDLHRRLDHGRLPLEEWASAENLGIKGFDYAQAAAFYPQVFERRFRDDPQEGYAHLEEVMEGHEPSLGYSILAQILDKTRHQVVVTTNFDNLVADAMGIYTQTHPLVAAHESLTEFVHTRLRRPLIAKIHRDLFFAPKNDRDGVSELEQGWQEALPRLFAHYTPIVIGYGGNDGSLMGLLEELPEGTLSGGLFWCYRHGDDPPNDRIARVVGRHKGRFVPILGFDELMLQIGDRFGYPLLADEIVKRAEKTAGRYREQVETIQRRLKEGREAGEETSAVKQALAATVKRKDDWWSWELKVRETEDIDEKERLYREGLRHCDSADLVGNFANFMTDVREDHDEAERLYRRALELDPDQANITGNFADFLEAIRGEHDEAERLFRRSLELNPNDANHTGNFAEIMLRHDRLEEAETLAKRLRELSSPTDPPLHAVAEFLLALIIRLRDGDETSVLARLKALLVSGAERRTWSFEHLLEKVEQRLEEEDRHLYRLLTEAIRDNAKLPALDEIPRWRDLEPIPPAPTQKA